MAESAQKSLVDIGKRLSQSRLNKDSLVKLLRQAAGALSELSQSRSLQRAIEPLNESLFRHKLLQHKDKDVRLLVAVCFSEIIRVLAPDPPYDDETLKDIFKLIISMFAELSDTTSPYFTRRVKMLETAAALKWCLPMLDICEDLVLEMFNVFFSCVREDHPQSLIQAMLSIMTQVLEEKVSHPVLDVILRNLLKEEKGVPPASFRLAVSVIQNCTEKIEPFVRVFLTSSILEKDAIGSELREYYHEIIFEIFQCAPQMLLAVIPNLTQELLTDQVDVRIKAVHLVGKLFALPGHHFAHEYRQLFVEFLKRFSDKSAEVRVSAVECSKACYMANPSGTEAIELLTALEGRLLDFDDKVRTQAVNAVCDLAKSNLRYIQPELILQAMERLRDKKVSVRRNAMQKLLELYRSYCSKCSEGLLTHSDHLEQIPCRILALCYDKDCKDFRPQNMELVLAEDLFPSTLSVEEKTKHWISLFSFFTTPHIKALNSILSQKQRLQMEMQVYLDLRRKQKENSSEELQKRSLASFVKMSASFVDPSKAEESFQKLHQMKDNSIFKALLQLIDERTTLQTAQTVRDTFLKRIGNKHPHYEFLRILSAKCTYTIFSAEHVQCILLGFLSEKGAEKRNLQTIGINLLLTIVNIFPSLLRGSEEHLLRLFSEGYSLNGKLLQMLAKAGPHISMKLRDVYPSLERICLEGTRLQSKYSVSAISALSDASNQLAFSDLYEKLVDSLLAARNVSTVLQSLGYIAQYSGPLYESREEEITQFIIQKLFQTTDVQSSSELTYVDDGFECSTSCKLKVYGLKTLVRSFLPHQGTRVRHQIAELLKILLRLLPEGGISDGFVSSESDTAHVRLAAAKSVLRLARRWDLHISPNIFHITVLKARDPSSHVRRSFLDKIHKLLKEHAIPTKYACSFALAASDCLKEIRDDSMKYLAEFIKEYGREARIRQNCAAHDSGETMTNYPEYVVVFLVHVLAHDLGFPSENCPDEDAYARFCSPLVVILKALVNPASVEGNKSDLSETVSYLVSIFRAIKKAEDAVDVCMTPKLHILSDIGMHIVKALSHTGIPLSRTPGRILLPSSFYKVSDDSKSEEENMKFLTRCSIDGSFVERILRTFEPHSVRPTSPNSKRGRKVQEDSMRLNLKTKANNLPLQEQTIPLTSKTTEEGENSYALGKELGKAARWQLSSKGRNKSALSPSDPHQGSTVDDDANGAPSDDIETNPENNKLSSSCGSVAIKPSLSGSQVSSEVEVVNCIPSEKNDWKRTNRRIPTEPTTQAKSNPGIHQKAKELGDTTEVLPGHRIKLWSAIDMCFYSGTIDEFDSQNSTHKVKYDNGEVERLCLENEHWEFIGDTPLAEKGESKFHSKDCDPATGSSISSLKKAVDTFGHKGAQGRKALSDKGKGNPDKETVCSVADLLGAVTEKRKHPEHSVPVRTTRSASEIIAEDAATMVRRSRRRKF
ncbi:sister chromatid cohesion protein PDS5 homolog B [Magnolia sinica]|uniref:sister chromatid cohesion protein PDS5 homolog B n=1 Tax=Magnolia sinica TaxID=86752 RepID=UPI0026594463|nr:sister chromatid cohesion protein PDS5 homolog B [Magnolia sinica]